MFEDLAAAARRVKHKVRSGQVDVFTHWATDEHTEPWAIRGLLAPEFDEPVFAEYLMSKPVMDYVHYFIGTDLTMGAILIFTNPHHADYSIGWHRDWGKLERDPDYDAEMAILRKPLTVGAGTLRRSTTPLCSSSRAATAATAPRRNAAACWRLVMPTSPVSSVSGSRPARPCSGPAIPSTPGSTARISSA